MAAKLADELLQMILAPSLTISQELLNSSSIGAFGRNDSVSSSSVLLVCKRWLRVATPLLYDAVVIRSTGQSQVLADVLRKNPAFAQHVKKIRIEGAYTSLGQVLVSCKNMKTLVMLLRIYSDANVTSLCRALPLISPTDVIIHDEWQIDNMKVRKVVIALCNAIPIWKEFTRFEYPYHRRVSPGNSLLGPSITRRTRLVDALSESTSIRLISCQMPLIDLYPWLPRLALIPSITLRVVYNSNFPSQRSCHTSMLSTIAKDAQLSKSLFEFVDVAENSPSTLNPTKQKELVFDLSSRSLSVSSIPKHIWTIIFSFATVPGYPIQPDLFYRRYSPPWYAPQLKSTRRCLSLVCKTFEEIVRPMFFIHPVIITAQCFHLFVKKVLQNPVLGSQVRVLSLMGLRDMVKIEDDLCDLIPHLTCLRHFAGSDPSFLSPCISAKVFMLLAETAGSTLATITWLNVSPTGALLSPTVLESFKVLATLDIPFHPPRFTNKTVMHADSLSTLRELRLGGSSKFLDKFSMLKLPQLRSVTLTGMSTSSIETFLEACGSSVEELVIEGFVSFKQILCHIPKLLELRWTPRPERATQASTLALALSPLIAHENLSRFMLNGVPTRGSSESEQSSIINTFFISIDFASFPRLKEITFTSYKWPIEERSISKDPLPSKAVLLKQQHGVDIKDLSGKPWRRRC